MLARPAKVKNYLAYKVPLGSRIHQSLPPNCGLVPTLLPYIPLQAGPDSSRPGLESNLRSFIPQKYRGIPFARHSRVHLHRPLWNLNHMYDHQMACNPRAVCHPALTYKLGSPPTVTSLNSKFLN